MGTQGRPCTCARMHGCACMAVHARLHTHARARAPPQVSALPAGLRGERRSQPPRCRSPGVCLQSIFMCFCHRGGSFHSDQPGRRLNDRRLVARLLWGGGRDGFQPPSPLPRRGFGGPSPWGRGCPAGGRGPALGGHKAAALGTGCVPLRANSCGFGGPPTPNTPPHTWPVG